MVILLNEDLSVTYIQGCIAQTPELRQGSHQEGCLPSVRIVSLLLGLRYPKAYLEDGDRVVADHVRPREGLGEEKEHKKCHGKKDSPGGQC